MEKKKNKNYLDKKEFHNEAVKCIESGKLSDELCKMYMLLVKNFVRKGSLHGYSFSEEFEGDAILMFVKNWKQYNPERGGQAFSYFTSFVMNAARQKLNSEKRQRKIRDKLLVSIGLDPSDSFDTEMRNKDLW